MSTAESLELGRVPDVQGYVLGAGPGVELALATYGSGEGCGGRGEDENDRTAGGGPSGGAAGVVEFNAFAHVRCVADVVAAVGTAEDVDEVRLFGGRRRKRTFG